MFFKPKVCHTFGVLQPLNVLQKIENNPVQGWTITQGPPLKTYVYLNKWTDGKNIKQTWTPVSAHEHPWTPMTKNLNVFRCVFNDFSKTMQFANYMSSLCFQNGWFIILGVWSWMFLSILLKQLEKSWYVCFFNLCWFGTQKKLSIAIVAAHFYI